MTEAEAPIFLKFKDWWPIAFIKRFYAPKRTTVCIGHIGKTIILSLTEEVEFRKNKAEAIRYWGIDLDLESAKKVTKDLQMHIDHVEAFTNGN